MNSWKKYVLWFAQEHVDFRSAEIESILKLWNIQMKTEENHVAEKPFWIVELPNDEAAKKLASRSVLLRSVVELWSHSNNIVKFQNNLMDYCNQNKNRIGYTFDNATSFKIAVETFNKKITLEDKIKKIESLNFLPVNGVVNLNNPDVQWLYFEYYGMDPNDIPEQPYDYIFGRWISDGDRNTINQLSLKKRKFIGNTSMDAQLSLLMANQGLVNKGDFVYDPFVGTGSLLVSAAKCGAFVIGSDIDYMTLHAKSKPTRVHEKVRANDESIYANLKQYQCEQFYLDVVISDFSRSIWKDNVIFDSIITDPPYGIREATEKIEFKTKKKTTVLNEDAVHYPSTSPYHLFNLYKDLLTFAAQHLKLNGRLVTWFPISKNEYTPELLPQHKCLHLIANSEQSLSADTSRRLLTYEKNVEYCDLENAFELKMAINFREKYFNYADTGRRAERKLVRYERYKQGVEEALKRGKGFDTDGKLKYLNQNGINHNLE